LVKKGAWVTIESIVLKPSKRPHSVPDDTRRTDFKKWVNGTLARRAQLGGPATIITPTGRKESGMLLDVNPSHAISYGTYVPELKKAGDQAREYLRGQLIENTEAGDDI